MSSSSGTDATSYQFHLQSAATSTPPSTPTPTSASRPPWPWTRSSSLEVEDGCEEGDVTPRAASAIDDDRHNRGEAKNLAREDRHNCLHSSFLHIFAMSAKNVLSWRNKKRPVSGCRRRTPSLVDELLNEIYARFPSNVHVLSSSPASSVVSVNNSAERRQLRLLGRHSVIGGYHGEESSSSRRRVDRQLLLSR